MADEHSEDVIEQPEASTKSIVLKALFQGLVVAVFYCAVGYDLIFLALQPAWPMLVAKARMAVTVKEPLYDTRPDLLYSAEARRLAESLPYEEPEEPKLPETYLHRSDIDFPKSGERYAWISCERVGLDAPVYWDDTEEILSLGVGQSVIGQPAGYGNVVLLAGHNTTYFACLYDVAVDDVIRFETDYCNYEYTVERIEVHNEEELGKLLIKMVTEGREKLVMYTCYPEYVVSWRKTDRLVVFARRTAGLDVR